MGAWPDGAGPPRDSGSSGPQVPQHVDVRRPPIARSSDDQIDVQDLPVPFAVAGVLGPGPGAPSGATQRFLGSSGLHAKLHSVDGRPRSHHLATAHDAMWPLALVVATFSSLVIHAFVQRLDQLPVGPRRSWSSERPSTDRIGIWPTSDTTSSQSLGKDGVDTRPELDRFWCGHTAPAGSYKGESSLGLRNSDLITSQVREWG